MEPKDTYYIDLITSYLNGEATPAQILELEHWVKENPEYRTLYQSYYKTWQSIQASTISNTTDLDHEWHALSSRISHPASRISHPSSLIPHPSSRISHPASRILFRIAAVLLVLLVPAFLLLRPFSSPKEIQLTASAGISECTLPDGTHVTLNSGATLTYPSKFSGEIRKVNLTGEAWFEVTHDAAHPFVIDAGKTDIQVLGTSFSVNTSATGNMKEVILANGKVKVFLEDDPANPVFLAPGEKADVSETTGRISKSGNGDVNFLAWKTRHIIFENTPLNEVAALLTKVYHLPVRISEANGLSGCKITATFDKQSLESVLNVLKATLDLQARDTGNGIELSGAGCN